MTFNEDTDVEFPLDSCTDYQGTHEIGHIIQINLKGKTKEEAQKIWNEILENQNLARRFEELEKKYQTAIEEYNKLFEKNLKLTSQNVDMMMKLKQPLKENEDHVLELAKKKEKLP